ncbi:MAG: ABC transporter permease [Tenericutes bacterium]|nr:ABC transporter permease [Mycoplasmatota bacterium]
MENTLIRDKLTNILKSIFIAIKRFITSPTLIYTIRRILSGLFTLTLILAVVTALIRLIPDIKLYDVRLYSKLAGTSVTAAENYKIVQLFKYGRVDLDGNRIPVIRNILQYIYNALPIPKSIPIRWDTRYTVVLKYWEGFSYLGTSMDTNKLVNEMLAERIGVSFRISISSVFFAYLIGYPFGIAMAKKPGGIIDRLGTVFIVLNYAIPALVFFLLMNKILGNPSGIFGALNLGYFYIAGDWRSLIAPVFSIVFLSVPGIIIWVRRFMVDQLTSDYVKFARSKGLTENRIMYVHVLRNAFVPLIRNVPAAFIFAIIGSYYVEVIWGIPGTGNLLISAIRATTPDVPVIQGLTLIYSAMSMIAFLLGDIVTVWFDPRIRLTHKGDI